MEEIALVDGPVLNNGRALRFPDESTLVVADLHIGYESVMEMDGTYLPRVQWAAMADSIGRLLVDTRSDRLVILGDLRHGFGRPTWEERVGVSSMVESLEELAEVVIVKGNHDNFISGIVDPSMVLDSVRVGGFTLVHGHLQCDSRPLVMAHEHPSIRLQDSIGAYVRLPAFLDFETSDVIVMPAFSPLSPGTDLISSPETMSPILADEDVASAVVYACSEIGLLELGTIRGLRDMRL